MNDLKIAYIEPLDGKEKNKPIQVLFNPAEYTLEKGNQYQTTTLPGLATPVTQFVNGQADTLTMELFFDTYAKSSRHDDSVKQGEDVRNYTKRLAALLDVDPTIHAPPRCRFVWGDPIGDPEGIHFEATIEKLTQKFTLFLDDGIPVRATLNVTFKEYKTIEQQLKEIGRQSADRTKRHIIKDGDSLWSLAAQEYNDPDLWRAIADANRILNPRLLETGVEIEVPALE